MINIPEKGTYLSDVEAMRLALTLAQRGFGKVSPNPPVGCVVLDSNNAFLSCGFHETFGEAHAEVNALNSISDQVLLEGSRWFVTLEPCSHQGKTGPCAKRLADLNPKISEVIYGCEDPNPQVAGRGLKILNEAGVETTLSELTELCKDLIEIFTYHVTQQRCYFAMKLASSWDGQLALLDGTSQWITNPQARERVHYLRAQFDAVMVGAGTFLRDDPSLNVRLEECPGHQNKVVIFDPNARTIERIKGSKLASLRSSKDIVVVCDPSHVDKVCYGNPIECPRALDGHVDWKKLQELLYGQGIYSCFIEAGSKLASMLLSWAEFQKLYLFYGNKFVGSSQGLPWSSQQTAHEMKDAPSLEELHFEILGDNILVSGRPKNQ